MDNGTSYHVPPLDPFLVLSLASAAGREALSPSLLLGVPPGRSQWQPQDCPCPVTCMADWALVASQRGQRSWHLPSSCRDPNSIAEDGRGAAVPRMNRQLP